MPYRDPERQRQAQRRWAADFRRTDFGREYRRLAKHEDADPSLPWCGSLELPDRDECLSGALIAPISSLGSMRVSFLTALMAAEVRRH